MAKTSKAKLSPYQKKLLDPRWQKKRLEILEAANWKCEWCSSSTQTLHVHHGYYRKGADPWDYADEYFHTLCHRCHEKAEYERGEIYRVIAMVPPSRLYDLLPTVITFAGEARPELVEAAEELPSDPEPEREPGWDEPADEAELEAFFGQLRNFLG